VLPSLVARPVALRRANRIAKRYLNGSVRRVGSSLFLTVPQPVMLDEANRARGCAFYESVLRELLHLLVHASGAVEHIRCTGRGEGECEWKAEWRE
jgi:hypothetical protein